MTQRPNQQYDEQTWRYLLVPMAIWTVGIVAVCAVGLTSNDGEIAATTTPGSSLVLTPAQAASVPRRLAERVAQQHQPLARPPHERHIDAPSPPGTDPAPHALAVAKVDRLRP